MERTLSVEFSLRYGVIGVYRDQYNPIFRIYPLPFVRISLNLRKRL